MQKYADYIKQIEIDALWSGRKHIIWDLDRQVNILSGVNGVGKSTILNKVVKSSQPKTLNYTYGNDHSSLDLLNKIGLLLL